MPSVCREAAQLVHRQARPLEESLQWVDELGGNLARAKTQQMAPANYTPTSQSTDMGRPFLLAPPGQEWRT